ncbi:hypothetical protein [Roseiterribacter gracilis]|uniref:hypothetical protein n=1 Tax=Roseiterribacter gracilis TaxID=2812848 RepID=UPI003B429D2C
MARIGWTDLLAYYRSLAGEGALPMRDRFDPVVGVPRAVAHLTLYGVEPAGFRVRLVGSEVARRGGGPQVGYMLDEIELASPILDAVRDALRRTIAGRKPVLVHYLAQYEEPVRWTSVYLPLIDASGAVCSIVAGTFHEIGEPMGNLRSFRADIDGDAFTAAGMSPPH